jgi:hypothetical protein
VKDVHTKDAGHRKEKTDDEKHVLDLLDSASPETLRAQTVVFSIGQL